MFCQFCHRIREVRWWLMMMFCQFCQQIREEQKTETRQLGGMISHGLTQRFRESGSVERLNLRG